MSHITMNRLVFLTELLIERERLRRLFYNQSHSLDPHPKGSPEAQTPLFFTSITSGLPSMPEMQK